jgi:benzoylformate decarboxylase
MYTIQSLWTAAHERLAVVFVILNNSSYRILKQRANAMQQFAAPRDLYVGMELDNPRIDFVSVARGMGVEAHRARTVADVRDLLAAALRADGPTLIDVEMDRGFKPV